MNNLRIRQATINDAQSIRDVLTASQWFTYDLLFDKEYIQKLISHYYNIARIKDEIRNVSSKWHGYYIAEEHGSVTGVIGGGMLDQTTAEVYVFYIDPILRGRGIGTRLLNSFTKIQKYRYGANEQWVAVAKGNNYGIPFYEARGFIFQHEERSYGTKEVDQDISLKYKRKI